MAGELCYLCSDEGSAEYPLVQCTWNDGEQCERMCCRLHHAPFNGSEYCLHHQGQMLLGVFNSIMTTVQGKLAVPPVLRTDTMEHLAEDALAEIMAIYGMLAQTGLGLNELHQNLIRGIRDKTLYGGIE